jgi:hypothetical protein
MLRNYVEWQYDKDNFGKVLVVQLKVAGDAYVLPQDYDEEWKAMIKRRNKGSMIFQDLESAIYAVQNPSGTAWDQIKKQAGPATTLGFPVKWRNILCIVRAVMGDAFKRSVYIKHLAYYIDKFDKKVPFIENDKGNVTVDPRLDDVEGDPVNLVSYRSGNVADLSEFGDHLRGIRPTPGDLTKKEFVDMLMTKYGLTKKEFLYRAFSSLTQVYFLSFSI